MYCLLVSRIDLTEYKLLMILNVGYVGEGGLCTCSDFLRRHCLALYQIEGFIKEIGILLKFK